MKIHQLVDGSGLPLVTLITPGQAGDSPMFLPLSSPGPSNYQKRPSHRPSSRGMGWEPQHMET